MSDAIKSLGELCNWTLLNGSHDWPGPDGGTCINEAAIVVGGFKYRTVADADDLPRCFSKALGAFLIFLNDNFNHENRQKLIKFILRLPGSADGKTVEKQRMFFIDRQMAKLFHRQPELDYYKPHNAFEDILLIFENATWGAQQWPANGAQNLLNYFCDQVIQVVDDAFAIGKQADPIDTGLVVERIEEMKAKTKVNEVA